MRLVLDTVGADSSVALPGYGCYDLATAAVGAEARIVLYDVDPATLAPDMDSLRAALRAGARVVIIASLYGLPYDWDAIAGLCADFGAIPVEDAAQALGGSWRGVPLGSLAPLATISFGRGKGWSGGRGGALVVRHGWTTGLVESARPAGPRSELETMMLGLAQHLLGRPGVFGVLRAVPGFGIGQTHYRDPRPPAEMPQSAAAIALATHQASVAENAVRRRHAARLLTMMSADASSTCVEPVREGGAGWLRFPLLRRGGLSGLRSASLAIRLGVGGSYPRVLRDLRPVQQRLPGSQRRLPGADLLVRDLMTLPTHSRLIERDFRALSEMFADHLTDGPSVVTRASGRIHPSVRTG